MITSGLLVRAVGYAVVAMLLNIIASVLWVVIYTVAIDPGHAASHYSDYAVRVASTVDIVAGLVLLFLAGWLIARGRPMRQAVGAAALVGLAYVVIDMALLFVAGQGLPVDKGLVAASIVTKIGGAIAGGALAGRARRAEPEDASTI